jgi:hypothetical protein
LEILFSDSKPAIVIHLSPKDKTDAARKVFMAVAGMIKSDVNMGEIIFDLKDESNHKNGYPKRNGHQMDITVPQIIFKTSKGDNVVLAEKPCEFTISGLIKKLEEQGIVIEREVLQGKKKKKR